MSLQWLEYKRIVLEQKAEKFIFLIFIIDDYQVTFIVFFLLIIQCALIFKQFSYILAIN